ncbi:MmgE/PrpD family protein [Pseudomonas saliphila]|uniref:MmgE/PrpD family protein n=1 Tax=Pseudomonas saliphila TaxID=2586906 RepID=UPI00123BFFB2|nr:MmgE/PrpD family protein [Pseudomonas saliphila]
MPTLIEELADYSVREAARPLDEQVVHHAKRAVLDWFSALYPGTREPVAQRLVKAYSDEVGIGKCSIPGFASTCLPGTAAWINGTSSHAIEFDDIFRDAVYHPGVPTVAAALAMGEQLNASGSDMLKAVVIGYEISTRIGAAVQPSHYRFFHTTGTIGCFASAAAAAFLLAPGDRKVMVNALGTAGSFASGLQQAFRSECMTKALHGGHAASAGITAARAAAAGVTGAVDMLEGEVGFGAAMSNDPQWSKAVAGLGEIYNITRITQKTHGCCGHTFAAIDAVQLLREQLSADEREQVQRIEVDTYQVALDVTGNYEPELAYQAKFSLPYVLVQALRYGSVRLAAFSSERLAEQHTRDMMQRVVLRADAELTRQFPGVRAARVKLILSDGRELEHFAPYRKGDPEAPMSDTELDDKFAELVAPILGEQAMGKLRGQLWRLDELQLKDLGLAAL